MRTLYHFQYSPFSRRTRLALAYKGLAHELLEGRAKPEAGEHARKLWPLRSVPVLVEEDGSAIGDSGAIVRYLDAAYPSPQPLWPIDAESARVSVEVAALVDGALNLLVDLGTRYYPLRADPAWEGVRGEMLGRAQAALDALSARAHARGPRPFTKHGWCAPDMWAFTAAIWLDGLPGRAPTNANAAQLVSLPWTVPAPLLRWADAFRQRDDVRALD